MFKKAFFVFSIFWLLSLSVFAQEIEVIELVNRAGEESRKGNLDTAIELYSSAIKLDSGYSSAYTGRGLAYMRKRTQNSNEQKQNFDNSLRDLSIAIDLKPDSVGVYINRSSIYSLRKEFEKALADLQKAEQIDAKFPHIYSARATIYLRMKEYQLAIDNYSKAIDIKPQSDFYRGRCNVFYDFGKFQEAVADCSEAININPKYVWAFYYRGLSRAKLEQNALAVSDFRKALELDPNHLGAKQELEKLLKNTKY